MRVADICMLARTGGGLLKIGPHAMKENGITKKSRKRVVCIGPANTPGVMRDKDGQEK